LTIRILDILPGVFTMGNLLCGFLSVRYSLSGEPVHAAWLIILASFFDALDGKLAKFAKSLLKFGVEFDSLADLVSFGLAPVVLVSPFLMGSLAPWAPILGFLFLLCGAFRLARFNIYFSGGEKTGYRGLPITMAGGTLAAYVVFCDQLWGRIRFPEFLLLLFILLSAFMISTFHYETYPELSWKGRGNRVKIVLFALCAVAIAVDPPVVFFPLALIYVMVGGVGGLYQFAKGIIVGQFSPKDR
jgi:CDP-diacylglycerol--serine O-phosphatidyltransferase